MAASARCKEVTQKRSEQRGEDVTQGNRIYKHTCCSQKLQKRPEQGDVDVTRGNGINKHTCESENTQKGAEQGDKDVACGSRVYQHTCDSQKLQKRPEQGDADVSHGNRVYKHTCESQNTQKGSEQGDKGATHGSRVYQHTCDNQGQVQYEQEDELHRNNNARVLHNLWMNLANTALADRRQTHNYILLNKKDSGEQPNTHIEHPNAQSVPGRSRSVNRNDWSGIIPFKRRHRSMDERVETASPMAEYQDAIEELKRIKEKERQLTEEIRKKGFAVMKHTCGKTKKRVDRTAISTQLPSDRRAGGDVAARGHGADQSSQIIPDDFQHPLQEMLESPQMKTISRVSPRKSPRKASPVSPQRTSPRKASPVSPQRKSPRKASPVSPQRTSPRKASPVSPQRKSSKKPVERVNGTAGILHSMFGPDFMRNKVITETKDRSCDTIGEGNVFHSGDKEKDEFILNKERCSDPEVIAIAGSRTSPKMSKTKKKKKGPGSEEKNHKKGESFTSLLKKKLSITNSSSVSIKTSDKTSSEKDNRGVPPTGQSVTKVGESVITPAGLARIGEMTREREAQPKTIPETPEEDIKHPDNIKANTNRSNHDVVGDTEIETRLRKKPDANKEQATCKSESGLQMPRERKSPIAIQSTSDDEKFNPESMAYYSTRDSLAGTYLKNTMNKIKEKVKNDLITAKEAKLLKDNECEITESEECIERITLKTGEKNYSRVFISDNDVDCKEYIPLSSPSDAHVPERVIKTSLEAKRACVPPALSTTFIERLGNKLSTNINRIRKGYQGDEAACEILPIKSADRFYPSALHWLGYKSSDARQKDCIVQADLVPPSMSKLIEKLRDKSTEVYQIGEKLKESNEVCKKSMDTLESRLDSIAAQAVYLEQVDRIQENEHRELQSLLSEKEKEYRELNDELWRVKSENANLTRTILDVHNRLVESKKEKKTLEESLSEADNGREQIEMENAFLEEDRSYLEASIRDRFEQIQNLQNCLKSAQTEMKDSRDAYVKEHRNYLHDLSQHVAKHNNILEEKALAIDANFRGRWVDTEMKVLDMEMTNNNLLTRMERLANVVATLETKTRRLKRELKSHRETVTLCTEIVEFVATKPSLQASDSRFARQASSFDT